MTGEELQDAIRKLREFAIVQGMQWVLDEVDEAIALGVPETRTLRQTTDRQGETTYEDVTPPDTLPFPSLGRGRHTGRPAGSGSSMSWPTPGFSGCSSPAANR